MKKLLTTVCLFVVTMVSGVCLFAPAVFGQGNNLTSRLRHEEAIRQVLARFEQALEKHDAAICAGEFANDAEWENDFGSRENGRVNIVRRLSAIYGMVRQPRQQIVELRIRFITGDVAVADVDREIFAHLSTEDDMRHPARKVRTTHVLKRKKDNWQVVVSRIAELRNPRYVP